MIPMSWGGAAAAFDDRGIDGFWDGVHGEGRAQLFRAPLSSVGLGVIGFSHGLRERKDFVPHSAQSGQ